jgi:hypothetical protein
MIVISNLTIKQKKMGLMDFFKGMFKGEESSNETIDTDMGATEDSQQESVSDQAQAQDEQGQNQSSESQDDSSSSDDFGSSDDSSSSESDSF